MSGPAPDGPGRRLPLLGAAAWLSPGWQYRVKITARQEFLETAGVLREFPLLVDGEVLRGVFSRAQPDGGDLVVTKRDGRTVLNHEIVSYDPGSQSAQIWFEADSLSQAVREFYVYYGNPDTSISAAGSVWNDDYAAVYHFEEDPGLGTLRDYTAAGNHASSRGPQSNWTSADVAPGPFGRAWLFNGTSHYINTRAIRIQDSTFVISCWLMNRGRTTDFAFQANPGFWHVSSQINVAGWPNYNIANPWRDLRWPQPVPQDGAFHYFTWVFDGVADTVQFYLDGQLQPAIPWAADPGVKHFYTGHPINPDGMSDVGIIGPMYWNGEDHMDGPGDEFRISRGQHAAEWISTEYANQRSPGAFYVVGAEETSTPVHLASFTVERLDQRAVLRWQVSDPSSDHLGFHVYRGAGAGDWTRISEALLSGSRDYTFIDENPPAGEVSYWLAETTARGVVFWYGPVVLAAATVERNQLYLHQNSPNPFARSTTIRFATGIQSPVRLRILDVRGREVRRLLERTLSPGIHALYWDGRNAQGTRLSPGIYFYSLESPRGFVTRKLVLL
jgi:hypothetical protein